MFQLPRPLLEKPEASAGGQLEKPAQGKPVELPTGLGLLSGTEALLRNNKKTDGTETAKTQVSLAIEVTSKNQVSRIVVPSFSDPEHTFFLTRPLRLKTSGLVSYLEKEGVHIKDWPEALQNVLNATELDCEAMYYSKSGPLLVMVKLAFQGGLLQALMGKEKKDATKAGSGDTSPPAPDAGQSPPSPAPNTSTTPTEETMSSIHDFFDLDSVSLRVFRCTTKDYPVLQAYAKELAAEPPKLTDEKKA